jgi:hypothetical protein
MPSELVHHFADRGGAHTGAMALVAMISIWFGFIAYLSQWGERGSFANFILFITVFAAAGMGESTPCGRETQRFFLNTKLNGYYR